MDGSDPANDWHGWIPFEQNPTVKNPPRGFVSSANQSSTDQTYPYYINWRFELYDRAKRINDRLKVMQNATVDSIRLMQMDDYSIRAQDVLPELAKYVDATKLNKNQQEVLRLVLKWDKHYAANSVGASVFNTWWLKFYGMVWDNKFADKKMLLNYPSMDRTEKILLAEPNSKWFDDINTPAKETCADIVMHSFTATADELFRKYGQPGEKWQWGNIKETHINHLANLPGFGAGQFFAGGTGGVINALRGGNGPSWRMVVEMGPQVKGYGIFPGGESGNPGSYYYEDMFETWKDGKLNELLFLQSPTEKSDRIKSTLTLSSK
jgi:penicillin amidase